MHMLWSDIEDRTKKNKNILNQANYMRAIGKIAEEWGKEE